jgi:hypothetical protein
MQIKSLTAAAALAVVGLFGDLSLEGTKVTKIKTTD